MSGTTRTGARALVALLVFGGISGLALTPASAGGAAAEGQAGPADLEVFERLTQEVITARNASLTGVGDTGDYAGAANLNAAATSVEKGVRNDLRQRGNALKASGTRYQAHDAKVTLRSVTVQAGGRAALARVTEESTFTFARITGDEPGVTAHAVERDVVFQKVGGTWRLAAINAAKSGGPAPMNDSSARAPDAARGPGDVLSADGRSQVAQSRRPDGEAKSSGPVIALSGYNYQAMANYATRYWSSYNNDYRTYADTGGDCTSFLSQAMRAGGWGEVTGFYQSTGAWWYNHVWGNQHWAENASWTWTNVGRWSTFARNTGRVYNLSNVWYMGLADALQIDFDKNGVKDHSMLVTYVGSAGERYMTYHTTNTLNRPLSDIIRQNASSWYYAYRT